MARNIRLVREGDVDTTDVRSLVATATAGCKTDREKMIALWAYIARSGFYHWCEAREDPEGACELGVVYDPITAFNVYGTVICYQVVDLLGNLAAEAGLGSRTRGVPGHRVLEVFYDGKWHLFDAQYDCAAYYVADDGQTIIDLAELCKDAGKYIRKPTHPSEPFYQFDRLGGKFWPWESKEHCIKKFYQPNVPKRGDCYAPYIARGHTMHLDLRRGEKLIRRFSNEGKWYCPPALYARWKRDKTQRWVDKAPHDPRNPANTYANGELVYQPNWKGSASGAGSNFWDGVHDSKNVRHLGADGWALLDAGGKGHLTFRVRTPYLIAGRPGKLDQPDDSTDGVVLEADFCRKDEAASNAVSVSTDNGLTFKQVWVNDKTGWRQLRLDLTRHVEGTYGYLVRVDFAGAKAMDAAMGRLRMRTSLFFSPIPLPRIRAGSNRFRFSLAEQQEVMCIRPDLGDAKGYRRFFHEIEALKYDRHFTRHLEPAGTQGHAVVEVAPPGKSRVVSLTVHVSLGTRGPDKHEKAEVLWATSPKGPWTSAWKSDFTPRNDKWRWDDSVEVKLPTPAPRCYVKVLLKRRRHMALNMLRIYARYLREFVPLKPGSVKITHAWTADGKDRTRTVTPKLPDETYTIRAEGKEIRNRSIAIEVANERGR